MKASELRIGNYLRYPKKNYFEITESDFKNDNFWQDIHDAIIEPIPITEDWLIRFGFEKVRIDYTLTHCYHYQNENCWIYLIHGGFEFELIVGKERFNLMRTYEYVHQLQNLYFALTGKELILKELNKNETFKNR